MGKSRKRASQSRARRQPSDLLPLPPPPPPPRVAAAPALPSIILRCNQEKKWKAVLGTAPKVEAPAAVVPQEAVAGASTAKAEKTITMTTRSKKAAAAVASTSQADGERCRRSRGQAEEEGGEEEGAAKRGKTVRFRLALSREEIMADFEAITGKKLPPRPKRHPKAVEENLSVMFPGSNMPQSITASRYKPKKSS